MSINFQSIKNKKEELGDVIDASNLDIIIGSETWLNPTVLSEEIFPGGYTAIRRDRSDGYGGVLIAVKDDIAFEELPSSQDCEAVFIKVALQGRKSLVVGSLYRAPSSNTEYMEKLCDLLSSTIQKYKTQYAG